MRIELHCHSNASDGALAPDALIALAAAHAVRVLALTDHDTIDGVPEAIAAGAAAGVRVLPGIEVSSVFAGKEVHVLGYGIAPDAPERLQLSALRTARVSRAQKILARLEALNISIAFEHVAKLAGDGMIGRPHVARALIEAGHAVSIDDAFRRYLAEGGPAHVPNDSLDPAQAIALIQRAHGCAVLAHPGLFKGDFDALMAHMLAAGLDGIEAYYPDHTPKLVARLEALARAHGLICTGGSDFHRVLSDGAVTLATQRLPRGVLEALDATIMRYAA
jgi:3',5'-nucleoside bisphosphate phosphatase